MLLKFKLLFRKFSAENGRHVGGFDMNIRMNVASWQNERRKADTWSAIMDKLNLLIDFLALEATQKRRATKTLQHYYQQPRKSILLLENGKIVKLSCVASGRFMT